MVKASVVGSLRVVRLNCTAVVVAEVAIIEQCGVHPLHFARLASSGWPARFLEQSAHECFAGLSGKEWIGHCTLLLLQGFS